MTTEQKTLLAEHCPEIFAAIKAADIGIRAILLLQVDTTLLGNISRLWQVETKRDSVYVGDTHYGYSIRFTYETVAVCLYSLIPKK